MVEVITEHAATVRITHGTLVPANPAAIPTVYTAAATTDAANQGSKGSVGTISRDDGACDPRLTAVYRRFRQKP
jgi:hypothetical protein